MIHRPFRLEQPHGVIRGEVRVPEGPPPRTAVVVVHGFKGYKDWGFFPWVAGQLVADRHAVVTFNLTGSGIGPRDPHGFTELEAFAANTYSRELADVAAVLREVRGGLLPRAPDRTGLLGHSRGGADAVLAAAGRNPAASRGPHEGAKAAARPDPEAAARPGPEAAARPGPEAGPPVDALVTWAALSGLDRWSDETRRIWREEGRIHVLNSRTGQQMPMDVGLLDDFEAHREELDVLAAAREVGVPWLVLHGTVDETVAVEHARRLAGAGPDARLELVDGAGHTFGAAHPFQGSNPLLDRAMDLTRRHLRTTLRPD